MKENLRIFAIVMGVIILVLVVLLYFSGAFEDEGAPINNEMVLTDGTKFPIEAYVFQSKKAQVSEESLFTKEEEKPKEETEDTLARLRNAIQTERYTPDIFPKREDTAAKERERERNRLLAMRLAPISGETPKNTWQKKPEPKTDFGDSQFDNLKKQDKASSETKLYRAITADRMIPAVLINAIYFTLEGKVTAQIEDDIYSSLGKTLLIPKGSRAIGFYTNNNRIGENRLRLTWQRIITPHGRNIMLTNAQSADILGNSGIVGIVDNRYWDRYGMPLALSTLTNSVLLLISQSQNENNTNTQIILDNSRQDLGYIMKNIIDEQVKIAPIIEVQAGSRIFINPTQDLWFPEPKGNEIIVQYFDKEKN